MTKADWLDWKAHPVTKAFFESLIQRREDMKEVLINQAGDNVYNDTIINGYAKALVDVYNTDFEEIENA